MSIKVEEHQHQQVLASDNANNDFNFDLWARAVKHQMVAALRKKTTY